MNMNLVGYQYEIIDGRYNENVGGVRDNLEDIFRESLGSGR